MMAFDTIRVNKEIPLPFKKRETDAGYDLYASESSILWPFQTKVIPSNHKILIDKGYFGFIQARSGIRQKGLLIEGIIDSGYQGIIGIMVTNCTPFPRMIKKRERVAQMMILKYENINFNEIDNFLEKTDRGESGFGDSGLE